MTEVSTEAKRRLSQALRHSNERLGFEGFIYENNPAVKSIIDTASANLASALEFELYEAAKNFVATYEQYDLPEPEESEPPEPTDTDSEETP